tara:strand:+ start:336 stop:512 length:177 start_codon:yes stop_codon:yes gene_type:complete
MEDIELQPEKAKAAKQKIKAKTVFLNTIIVTLYERKILLENNYEVTNAGSKIPVHSVG